jgi:hypothetical protein
MPLRTITATRYVTPLREGGSLPAIIEADDDGLYVLKFRGAGQGPKALIAELVAGELARAMGLAVPEIVLVQLDPDIACTEPDAEIQDLVRASAGLNLALDYLPGALAFDPLLAQPDADTASAVVWLDAFVANVDRSARNTNMLWWHRRLWLIDHGAALYFHHDWPRQHDRAQQPFAAIRDHVLLPAASRLPEADTLGVQRLTRQLIADVVALIPDAWLSNEPFFANADEHRAAYERYLVSRLASPREFVEEAIRARSVGV